MSYKIIRDIKASEVDESRIEACDNREEIVQFSIKEIMNLSLELQESDCRDIDIFSDLIELIYNLAEISYINLEDVDDMMDWKNENEGSYSKFLLKVNEL